MKTILLATAFAFLAVGLNGAEETTHTLKLYESKVGDVIKYTKTKNGTGTVTFEMNGTKRVDTNKTSETTKYTEEVLAKPAGAEKATKLSRTYETAEKTLKKEVTKLPYHGETIVIEKVDGKYTFSIGGKAMSQDDAEDLDKEFNKKGQDISNKEFLPKKPVKIGDTWQPDVKKMIESLNADEHVTADAKKSTIDCKLMKVFEKDGAKWGTLEITMKVVLSKMKAGDEPLDLKEGSVMTMVFLSDLCIDGSAAGEKSTVKMTTRIEAALPNGTLVVEGKDSGTETEELVKKK